MISTKITLQRMENQIVGTKITRPRVAQYKNYSPKRWMVGGTKITRQRDGESNGRHENNSPKGWIVQK